MPEPKTPRKPKHKHAFVGVDLSGDACIYVVYIDADGTTGEFLPHDLLQKLADKINNGRILNANV